MRHVDDASIEAYGAVRFRSEYDYAVFEYHRSAKLLAFLERSGRTVCGRVLDAGCGPGGIGISVAEEAAFVTAIDIENRFQQAGRRLARERGQPNIHFLLANGLQLPFANEAFDVVLSHAVIEHVADPLQYLRECARVLKPTGHIYLSTAPYLSFAGAHLPRLKVPVPLHLALGRRAAFAIFRFLARHAAWTLRERRDASSFIKLAEQGETKRDDLLERVRVHRLRRQITDAGLRIACEELHVTQTIRRLPTVLQRWVRHNAFVRDCFISSMEYSLAQRT